MRREAAITVRLPFGLKQRLAARAKREHRSISAQVVYELERAVAAEPSPRTADKALGLFEGAKLPKDEDLV